MPQPAPLFRLLLRIVLSFSGLVSGGCVSSKYKLAGPAMPPPVTFNAVARHEAPPVTVVLHSVITFKGPGAWKHEAYWDEYAVTVTNRGAEPLTLDRAVIVDVWDQGRLAGENPWKIEASSRRILRDYRHLDRQVLLGAGLASAWVTSGVIGGAGLMGGSAGAVYVGAAGIVAIPAWLIGSGVRSYVARHELEAEFTRRRLALPRSLAPGESVTGSLFFPIAPGPRHLLLRFAGPDGPKREIGIDLSPLADLHLRPVPGQKGGQPKVESR